MRTPRNRPAAKEYLPKLFIRVLRMELLIAFQLRNASICPQPVRNNSSYGDESKSASEALKLRNAASALFATGT